MATHLEIAVVTGSTRPGRKSDSVAAWVTETANAAGMAAYTYLDLAAFDLPLLNEPLPPRFAAMSGADYAHDHTKRWSSAIKRFDGFIFVTPEYNFGVPAALKNGLDYLYAEWNDKVAGIVSYGSAGGVKCAAQLRLSLGELQVATVSAEVNLSLYTDFENFTTFRPAPGRGDQLSLMLAQMNRWGEALKHIRRHHGD